MARSNFSITLPVWLNDAYDNLAPSKAAAMTAAIRMATTSTQSTNQEMSPSRSSSTDIRELGLPRRDTQNLGHTLMARLSQPACPTVRIGTCQPPEAMAALGELSDQLRLSREETLRLCMENYLSKHVRR